MLQPDFIYRSLLEQELVSHDEAIARQLTNKAHPRELQPNQMLYAKGDEANFIFFVLDGSCKLVDDDSVIAVIKRGTSLGEFPLLGVSRAYAVTAVAVEKSIFAQVSYSDFRDIAVKYPQIWELVAAMLARRLNGQLLSRADG
jgi:CRP-like cAMP-binding protein